tara:strand:- start:29 stop:277 length:249 start_codon:yes stop_codon:yes gene_type:complete
MVTYISLAILVTFISILIWKDATCKTIPRSTITLYPDDMNYDTALEIVKEINKLVEQLDKTGWEYSRYNMISSLRRKRDDNV